MVQRRTRSDHAVRCVADLIDHMIIETIKLYKGTDMEHKVTLFHDALAQWNEGKAQVYLEEHHLGWAARFIKPVGKTCADRKSVV